MFVFSLTPPTGMNHTWCDMVTKCKQPPHYQPIKSTQKHTTHTQTRSLTKSYNKIAIWAFCLLWCSPCHICCLLSLRPLPITGNLPEKCCTQKPADRVGLYTEAWVLIRVYEYVAGLKCRDHPCKVAGASLFRSNNVHSIRHLSGIWSWRFSDYFWGAITYKLKSRWYSSCESVNIFFLVFHFFVFLYDWYFQHSSDFISLAWIKKCHQFWTSFQEIGRVALSFSVQALLD